MRRYAKRLPTLVSTYSDILGGNKKEESAVSILANETWNEPVELVVRFCIKEAYIALINPCNPRDWGYEVREGNKVRGAKREWEKKRVKPNG